jgi:hypothetical protein
MLAVLFQLVALGFCNLACADSDGRHGSIREPAKTAHPRRIEGQKRSFDINCEGSSRSGIFPRATSNNPCLGEDELERGRRERGEIAALRAGG